MRSEHTHTLGIHQKINALNIHSVAALTVLDTRAQPKS